MFFVELRNWLNKPFPFESEARQNLILSFLFGLFIFLFLVIFQPFTVAEDQHSIILTTLGYAIITTSMMIFNFFIPALVVPKIFDPDTSKVKHTLFFSFWHMLTISIANWLYYRYGPFYAEHNRSLLYFVLATFSIGSIPLTFMIFWFERVYYLKHTQQADQINQEIHSLPSVSSQLQITLKGEGKQDLIEAHADNLLCLKSDGNYVEIYQYRKPGPEKTVIRARLKDLEKQLEGFCCFGRVHQSYIANYKHITKVSGNARGYQLTLRDLDFSIPVSRKFNISQISRT